MDVKKVPIGIKTISIYYFVVAGLSLLLGFLLLIGGAAYFGILTNNLGVNNGILNIIMVILGSILSVVILLNFFLGMFLLKGKNWARITALVFNSLGVISNLVSLIMISANPLYRNNPLIFVGIIVYVILILISVAIIWYLGFNPEGKNYFTSK